MGEFTKPLNLVTPYMTGTPVRDAQWLLAGNSRFAGLAPYKDGTVDGVYGPVTAQATKRAKYWLGYPVSAINTTFGQTLYEYLRPNNWRPLPDAYRRRRDERAAAVTPGSRALELARTQLGTKESPAGSNCQQYGSWYGFNCVAWCAIFDSWCFGHSGYVDSAGRSRFKYAAVVNIVFDARANRNGLRVVWSPVPGDLATYTEHGDPYAHVAFFDGWIDEPTGTFRDLGGNTGPSSLSNGGEVASGERSRSQVTAFVRVG